ncbi:MAG: polysaccharide deacetylase family protein [Bacillota bacterium]|jgi:peptidoglycan/xylan/chitin deacetylase (PgdA/CDA1 family)|nr:polysaccharide deacetylase family protein [Bacillota bacterium]HHU43190.1 polysaccharide deacetylase family protein [Clostridiales bacterium]
MKKTGAFIKVFKLHKDSLFVHILSNIIIVAVILSFYIATLNSSSAITANAPIYRGDTSQKKISLMINVYWGEEYIPDMLEVLERYDAACTFFIGGVWASKNIAVVQEISKNHELGNHGYLHKDHKNLSLKQNRDEIVMCEKLIQEATGIKTKLFAPPSGSIGDNMLKVCEELDYKVIMWSKDTIDWRDSDYKLVYRRATNDLKNGDLILMHPSAHTLKALPMILDYYRQNGYKAVKVSELLLSNSQ